MTNLTPGTGKCAVIGYGSWATAIVKVLSERGIEVRWYIRNPDVLESLRTTGRNCKYLRDVKFDISRLVLSDDINATVAEADTVVLAVPSAFLKVFLQPLEVPLRDKFVISAVKGIIPDEYQTVIDYVTQRYGLNEERTGIITGPSHAEEVGREGCRTSRPYAPTNGAHMNSARCLPPTTYASPTRPTCTAWSMLRS